MAQINRGKLRGKQFKLDAAVLLALEALAHDSGRDMHALAHEAFADLLKKYRRPQTVKDALRESLRAVPANDPPLKPKRGRQKADG